MVIKMKLKLSILTVLIILTSSTAFAQRLTVGVETANIRSGPSQTHDVLWQVEKYHPVVIIEKTGSWCHFKDFEGDKGWIHGSLLRSIPSIITIKEKCNIRSGPGTKYEIVLTVGKGIPFKVVEEKNNWIHIRHADGDSGWIHNSLVW